MVIHIQGAKKKTLSDARLEIAAPANRHSADDLDAFVNILLVAARNRLTLSRR
jgi:hypothetical protein